MPYTPVTAAKVSGFDELMIRDAIERGQIIAVKDIFGEWQIADTDVRNLASQFRQQIDARSAPSVEELGGPTSLEAESGP